MVPRRALAAAYLASLRPATRRFENALRQPEAAQAQRLQTILADMASSSRGKELGLKAHWSPREFQEHVPLGQKRDIDPYVHRIAQGEADVLTRSPVRWMERTGGTTGQPRLLPITDAFLGEIQQATAPWLGDLHAQHPGLRGLRSYWSVSPVAQAPQRTAGGLPIGAPDDTEYFGAVAKWVHGRMMAVPSEVSRVSATEAWRQATLRHLARCEDLGLISVWSPTFLHLLLDALEAAAPDLLAQLPAAHAQRVRRRLREGRPLPLALWPRLRLVSCWTEGTTARLGLDESLRVRLPGIPIQGKGLLATEGVVSIPYQGAPVVAATSHFLEFVDEGNPDGRPLLAHELRAGMVCTLLLTTGAGLLRHPLGDRVECIGHLHGTPRLRFLGRADATSDLCGEKLDERQVAQAMATVFARPPTFALLAPELAPRPHYRLFVDGVSGDEAQRAAHALDEALQQSHPYQYCRQLGQLGPVTAHVVPRAWAKYASQRMQDGARLGDVKPCLLDPRPGWAACLEATP